MASFTVRTRAVSNRLRTSDFRSWLMKTFLANAFAVGRPSAVHEFHLSRRDTNAPELSLLIINSVLEQIKRTEVLFYYSMIEHSSKRLFWAHWFIQSKIASTQRHRSTRGKLANQPPLRVTPIRVNQVYGSDPTTSFLTSAMTIYTSGAGITAAAGTRLALHWVIDELFRLNSLK